MSDNVGTDFVQQIPLMIGNVPAVPLSTRPHGLDERRDGTQYPPVVLRQSVLAVGLQRIQDFVELAAHVGGYDRIMSERPIPEKGIVIFLYPETDVQMIETFGLPRLQLMRYARRNQKQAPRLNRVD
jgi:hypothetical protein